MQLESHFPYQFNRREITIFNSEVSVILRFISRTLTFLSSDLGS